MQASATSSELNVTTLPPRARRALTRKLRSGKRSHGEGSYTDIPSRGKFRVQICLRTEGGSRSVPNVSPLTDGTGVCEREDEAPMRRVWLMGPRRVSEPVPA